MNQRFEDLMYRSGLTAQGSWDSMDPYDQQAIKRFAELIVSECSRIADDWVNNEDNGKNYPSDKIKQHFGVKE